MPDIIREALKRFNIVVEAEKDIRKEALDDLKFRTGDQWPADIATVRNDRPCLTINKLPQFIRQVTNAQRQRRPAIEVSPSDSDATVEVAEVLQSLIRGIEVESDADTAYDTAFNGAVGNSFGYFRIITEYENPTSFDQVVRIKRIRNPFVVFMDPSCQEADYSDANFGFIIEDMMDSEFKLTYPKAKLSQMSDWAALGANTDNWVKTDGCRIAEYFVREYTSTTISLLSDGTVVDKSTIPTDAEGYDVLPDGVSVVKERSTKIPKIMWYKINGIEILEQTEWPGKWIPIVPVLGDEIDVNGKKVLESVTRYAKDSQRMYNYWSSSETEMIIMAPKTPHIGYEGQFEGHEDEWRRSNNENLAYLQVKAKAVNGQVLPLPQRNNYEPPIQAISLARKQSNDDMQATTGIYDSSLGQRSNENSAKAILAREQQAGNGTYHYGDNFHRSIRFAGRIIIDLIPIIYDTARTVKCVGSDDKVTMQAINQIFHLDGIEKMYDLRKGTYEVVVTPGPSFATKRIEAVESMMQIVQSWPKFMDIAGDLLVKNMDWPGARQASERIVKTLPQGLVEPEMITMPDGHKVPKEQPPLPPQIQEVLQKGQAMIQQLSQEVQQLSGTLESKKLDLESKERIAFAQMQTQVTIAMATLGQKDDHKALDTEMNNLQTRLDQLKMSAPVGDDGQQQPQQPTGGETPGQQPMQNMPNNEY